MATGGFVSFVDVIDLEGSGGSIGTGQVRFVPAACSTGFMATGGFVSFVNVIDLEGAGGSIGTGWVRFVPAACSTGLMATGGFVSFVNVIDLGGAGGSIGMGRVRLVPAACSTGSAGFVSHSANRADARAFGKWPLRQRPAVLDLRLKLKIHADCLYHGGRTGCGSESRQDLQKMGETLFWGPVNGGRRRYRRVPVSRSPTAKAGHDCH